MKKVILSLVVALSLFVCFVVVGFASDVSCHYPFFNSYATFFRLSSGTSVSGTLHPSSILTSTFLSSEQHSLCNEFMIRIFNEKTVGSYNYISTLVPAGIYTSTISFYSAPGLTYDDVKDFIVFEAITQLMADGYSPENLLIPTSLSFDQMGYSVFPDGSKFMRYCITFQYRIPVDIQPTSTTPLVFRMIFKNNIPVYNLGFDAVPVGYWPSSNPISVESGLYSLLTNQQVILNSMNSNFSQLIALSSATNDNFQQSYDPVISDKVSEAETIIQGTEEVEQGIIDQVATSKIDPAGFKLPFATVNGIMFISNLWTSCFEQLGDYKIILTFPLYIGIALMMIGRLGVALGGASRMRRDVKHDMQSTGKDVD